VIAVPALANTPPSVPGPTAVPRVAAPRPTGSWQTQSAAQPVPAPALGPSVFDDVSPADLSRGKPKAAAKAAIADNPAYSPSGSITGEIFTRVKSELAESEKVESQKLPYSVSMAMAGLGVPGAMSLFVGFAFLFGLGSSFLADHGSEFLIFLFIVCELFAALTITSAVLLYMRVPFARPLAYFSAAVIFCTSCVNPVHMICTIIICWFLAMPETGVYLARKGELGIIDW
jgi:hypothetical protein